MTPFVSGALGALAVLFALALLRHAFWFHRVHRRGGGRPPLRFLFRRLGTRPEQEQVISAEADAIASEVRALRDEFRGVREEVADLLASPATDATALRAALDARMARLDALRARLADGLARVHAALDPAQRSALAALVREGPHGHHHHHRCARAC